MNDEQQTRYAPIMTRLCQKAVIAHIPIHGVFELSPLCNFQCRMCYVRKTAQEVAASPYPMRSFDEWLQLGREARDAGMLYLLLTGGEPLLWPRFWDLYDALYDMGLVLGVNTNGSLIDEKAIVHWRQRPPQRVNITLYGASDATYEALCGAKHVFSRVRENILALKNSGISVKLNCSLTPQNAGDLEAICSFAKENDIYISVVTYMFPPVRRDASSTGWNERFTPEEAAWYHMQGYRYLSGEEAYLEFLKRLRDGMVEPLGLDEGCIDPADGKIRCLAARGSFWMTWDGFMTPCGMMPGPRISLNDKTFSEAWQQLLQIGRDIRASSICEKCPDHQTCDSCVAMGYAETGRTEGIPTYVCEMVRSMKQLAARELEGSTNN